MPRRQSKFLFACARLTRETTNRNPKTDSTLRFRPLGQAHGCIPRPSIRHQPSQPMVLFSAVGLFGGRAGGGEPRTCLSQAPRRDQAALRRPRLGAGAALSRELKASGSRANSGPKLTRPWPQHGRQLGSAITTAARHLFRANHPAAFGLQLRELDVKVLVEGADAGVTDAGHGCHLEV